MKYFGPTDYTGYGGTHVDSTEGCLDQNASNYDPNATTQAYDQNGNLLCVFGSCDELLVSYPDGACLYGTGDSAHVGLFQPDSDPPFGPTECIDGVLLVYLVLSL